MTRAFIILVLTLLTARADLTWTDPLASNWQLEGRPFPSETHTNYNRLPDRFQTIARPGIWNLSKNSAGLAYRFFTDSPTILIKHTVTGEPNFHHMPTTGRAWPDLLRRDTEGNWQICHPRPTKEGLAYNGLSPSPTGRPLEYLLFLPTYSTTATLKIATEPGKKITPIAPSTVPPVVIWGTSIVQGACATRPGTAWTAQLRLNLDLPITNLGFSGSCRLDPKLTTEFSKIKATAFIIDPLANNENRPLPELEKLLTSTIETFRSTQANTPLIMIQHAGSAQANTQPAKQNHINKMNQILRKIITTRQTAGDENIHLIPATDLAFTTTPFTSVDGIHPNDHGMLLQAEAVEKHLRKILQIPAEKISTRPVTHDRDFYPWRARHLTKKQEVATQKPDLIFIGDSITHFWTDRTPNAKLSWAAMLANTTNANLGFGWDRTENTLWHLHHNILGDHSPKQIIILIGTNNLQRDNNQTIIAGIDAIIKTLKQKHPTTKILLLGILPRKDLESRLTNELNPAYEALAKKQKITYANPGNTLLNPNGKINSTLFKDGLHPNAKGYQKLATALKPHLFLNQ